MNCVESTIEEVLEDKLEKKLLNEPAEDKVLDGTASQTSIENAENSIKVGECAQNEISNEERIYRPLSELQPLHLFWLRIVLQRRDVELLQHLL